MIFLSGNNFSSKIYQAKVYFRGSFIVSLIKCNKFLGEKNEKKGIKLKVFLFCFLSPFYEDCEKWKLESLGLVFLNRRCSKLLLFTGFSFRQNRTQKNHLLTICSRLRMRVKNSARHLHFA